MSDHVWYACYGSNLLQQRFLCYIRGGQAPGSKFTNPGARDTTPPSDIRPYRFGHALYFGEAIPQWQHGGVGFLSIEPDPEAWSYGRIYRITAEQFDDVVLQENGLTPGASERTIPHPPPGRSQVIFDSIYGRIMCLEELEGSPVLTFTRPRDLPPEQRRQPSPQYLRTILAGLLETNPGIARDELVSYFMGTEAGEFGAQGIMDIIDDLESST